MIEEMQWLKDKYNRKTFCYVDPSFNISPKWNDDFSHGVIKEKMDIDMSCWYRLDCLLRDEKRDALKWQFKAGVKQVMTGVERLTKSALNILIFFLYDFSL